MDHPIVTLPDRNTMLDALKHFAGSSPSLLNFYPTLLEHAGQQGSVEGIVTLLVFAIEGHTSGMPQIAADLLYMEAPLFIDALLFPKQILADQAKALFSERLLH